MSKSAGSGEFSAAVRWKQSPFKQIQRYTLAREGENMASNSFV